MNYVTCDICNSVKMSSFLLWSQLVYCNAVISKKNELFIFSQSSSSFLSRFQFFGSTVTKKSPSVSVSSFPVLLHLHPFLPSLYLIHPPSLPVLLKVTTFKVPKRSPFPFLVILTDPSGWFFVLKAVSYPLSACWA
jgi:hypothetical protein